MGVGGGFSMAQEGDGRAGGHIQVEYQVGLGQTQLAELELVEPPEEGVPFLRGQLGRLVDGVGGGVPVTEHQTALLVPVPPILPIGGVPVYSEEGGGGVGVHVPRSGAESAVQIQADEGGGFLLVAGEDHIAEGHLFPLQPLAQLLELSGFAGTVGPLDDDECALHSCHVPFPSQTVIILYIIP